jgi:hypothetical protein
MEARGVWKMSETFHHNEHKEHEEKHEEVFWRFAPK